MITQLTNIKCWPQELVIQDILVLFSILHNLCIWVVWGVLGGYKNLSLKAVINIADDLSSMEVDICLIDTLTCPMAVQSLSTIHTGSGIGGSVFGLLSCGLPRS